MQKHKLNKPMKKTKNEISKILPFGKPQNQTSPNGNLHGGKEDLAGTSNVQLWPVRFWDKGWISIQEVSISFSLITKMNLLKPRLTMTKQTGQSTSFTLAIYTSKASKCQKA